MDGSLLEELTAVAQDAADAARAITLEYFRADRIEVANKLSEGFDPVTRADQDAELAIRRVIEAARPDDGIIGEEHGIKPGRNGLNWVVDPIDGTRGYISGTPTWGTLISVADGTRPIIGLIDQPYIGERFLGGAHGAQLSRGSEVVPIRARPATALAEATLFTTFPEIGTPEEAAAFRKLDGKVRLTRYGMDCYAYALLAAGQIDLVVEAGLQIYDIQAPIAVVEAAGGLIRNWEGGSADEGGRVVAAASPALLDAALECLAGVP